MTLDQILVAFGLPRPQLEYPFAVEQKRKFRFDAAWPQLPDGREAKVALEVDGGVWTRGRHTRGQGFINDQEKTNLAGLLGWTVLRCTPGDLGSGRIVPTIQAALRAKGWGG